MQFGITKYSFKAFSLHLLYILHSCCVGRRFSTVSHVNDEKEFFYLRFEVILKLLAESLML